MGWRDWVRTVEIEPSLYAADFTRLGEEAEVMLRAGVRVFHFDVGDGHFVEPITMGPIVLESIAPHIHAVEGAAIDCHLMVDNPTRHFPQIAKAGGDSVTFHYEAVEDVPATISVAREHELAERGRGKVEDHPLVGAVAVGGGESVGEGWYEYAKVDHAEAVALDQAGDRARGSTLYVTLEPCNHRGRTPPCSQAVIDA